VPALVACALVQAVAATASQMAAGVEQVAATAQSVAAASEQTRASAEHGAWAVRETVGGMPGIKAVVRGRLGCCIWRRTKRCISRGSCNEGLDTLTGTSSGGQWSRGARARWGVKA
jgi:hypothetical protein